MVGLYLDSYGTHLNEAIKFVRNILNLGLMDTKAVVSSLPTVIKIYNNMEDANTDLQNYSRLASLNASTVVYRLSEIVDLAGIKENIKGRHLTKGISLYF